MSNTKWIHVHIIDSCDVLTFHYAQILNAKIPFANHLIAQCAGTSFIWIVIWFILSTETSEMDKRLELMHPAEWDPTSNGQFQALT